MWSPASPKYLLPPTCELVTRLIWYLCIKTSWRGWRGNFMFSPLFTFQAREVITLGCKSIPLQTNKVIKVGRYLNSQGNLIKKQFVLANIYSPNIFSKTYFSLWALFLIAGDFSCTLDPVRENSSGVQSRPQSRGIILHFMKEIIQIDTNKVFMHTTQWLMINQWFNQHASYVFSASP